MELRLCLFKMLQFGDPSLTAKYTKHKTKNKWTDHFSSVFRPGMANIDLWPWRLSMDNVRTNQHAKYLCQVV